MVRCCGSTYGRGGASTRAVAGAVAVAVRSTGLRADCRWMAAQLSMGALVAAAAAAVAAAAAAVAAIWVVWAPRSRGAVRRRSMPSS